MVTGEATKLVGTEMRRKEDPRFITGEGKYTDDVHLRGIVYMAVLRSPHAHAHIRRIDTSKARQHPEVLAVLTGEDVETRCKAPLPLVGLEEDMHPKTRWAMATGKVRMVGEPVAAVAATSRGAAKDALELVEVEYEALPSVNDIERALEAGAPTIHEDLGTNLCFEMSGQVGDPDGAFREAAGVVSVRLEHPRVVPNPIEPRAVVASYERGTGNLTVWDTTQEPHAVRNDLAEVLGVPENKVRVIAIDVGGGFGAKVTTYPEVYVAALLSMQLARPVKWVEERQEHFVSTSHGRGHLLYVDAAYGKDGTLLGMRLQFFSDLGAYCHRSTHMSTKGLSHTGAAGVYKVQNLAWTTRAVYTNAMPVGAYRAFAKGQAIYITERVMDLIAQELDMDPAEVRRRNFIQKDEFPYMAPTGLEYDSGDYELGLDQVLGIAGYNELREEQRQLREQGLLMGIGIATDIEISGFGPASGLSSRAGFESATIRVDPTGKVTLLTGSSPHGQGHETIFSQIAADQMGVPFEDIEVLHSDTAIVPYGNGTFGNRSLVVGGNAIVKATERVNEKATQIAAVLLNVDPDRVLLEGGKFFAENIPDRSVTWEEVGREAHQARSIPRDMERGLEATAFWEPLKYTFPYNANVAVVRIDRDTGDVKLQKYALVDDCGVVVNPLLLEGQIHGGIAQGVGQALLEEAIWDSSGQLVTGSFMDYAMPLAFELPSFEMGRTVSPSPNNPMGFKGGGETGTCGATAAIVNAVVDALSPLGVTHIDMPVTSEKVWRVLQEKGGAQ